MADMLLSFHLLSTIPTNKLRRRAGRGEGSRAGTCTQPQRSLGKKAELLKLQSTYELVLL